MGVVIKVKVITVATAGTRVPVVSSGNIADSTNVVGCIVQAGSNTIYVGDSAVSASNGLALIASSHDKQAFPLDNSNQFALDTLYLDASTNGSVATVVYFVRV